MIVTPEGLNVFPEDVEQAINAQPGVRDSAVVGAAAPGSTSERVHAVLVLEPGADVDAIVRARQRAARRSPEDPRRRGLAGGELPRTDGTRKLKRRELKALDRRRAHAGSRAPADASGSLGAQCSRASRRADIIAPTTTIDELGLSSLERVELMMALEEAFQVTVDEGAVRRSTHRRRSRALTQPLEPAAAGTGHVAPRRVIRVPAWNQSRAARALRRVSLPTWILPLGRVFARVEVRGARAPARASTGR